MYSNALSHEDLMCSDEWDFYRSISAIWDGSKFVCHQ